MMVTFVSQCQKKSLTRTRRVLDAFANRIGDNTWQTVITEDGLIAVKKLLRQSASKNTAVSCHWIRSRSRSELVWVVGNRSQFNAQGIVPVNTTSVSQALSENFSLNTQVIALLSSAAGLFHDVGKATKLFQDKLQSDYEGIRYEPYRHEWVSLRIFQAFVGDRDDKAWLENLANINNQDEDKMLEKLSLLRDGISKNPPNPFIKLPPVAKIVAWLIISHHKLPQYPERNDNPPTFDNIDQWLEGCFEPCWNSPQCLNDDWAADILNKNWAFPEGTPLKSAHWQTQASILATKILRNERVFSQDWFNQHFTMHISRLSLMLSDHFYSNEGTSPDWQDRNYHAYANTDKDENGVRYRKQKLDEHNIAVGIYAYKIAMALPSLREELPALKPNKSFTDHVSKQHQLDFGWQDNAYQLAESIKDDAKKYGFFGICKASTGKGKTLANARIMYGISDEDNCRFSVALGLRTLTLQTGNALKENLKLNNDELAILIGSQAVKDLHQQSTTPEVSEQELNGSESAESLLKDEMALIEDLPEFTGEVADWFEHDPKILKLIQAPVLVSTIDYLMPANEGIRGGRQIAPMLRLLTSDLVLDEPDDFGLDDLPALCRLVNWAGMLGSRVLLSTATMSPALANALFAAYQAGRKQFTQVNGEQSETQKICCAWFDEFKKPQSALIENTTIFNNAHHAFVEKRIENLKKDASPLRKARLIALERGSDKLPSKLLASVIRQSIENLHQKNAIAIDDKCVSIGLVRMANIDPLVHLSKVLLATNAPNETLIHYCIYHSQFPLLQRSKIEEQLDKALSRHDEQTWIAGSDIPKIIKAHSEKHHIFVVLATAVAEVGRDHDYDWAIVEPSSMRSIIQLAGRVQRHRKKVPLDENIHILSKNFKGLKGKTPCFEKPGYESTKLRYASVDLTDLASEGEFKEINAISRITAPSTLSLTTETPPRFKSFNELEHFSQTLRLSGSNNEQNHAAQWWKNEVTWCGQLQAIQPFRKSLPSDDFNLIFTRTNKAIWQKKIPKTSPPRYENTTDIAEQQEAITMGNGVKFWGQFDLQAQVAKLVQLTGDSEAFVLKRFTHLALKKLDENSDVQWQYHNKLGIYKTLKKDEYENE